MNNLKQKYKDYLIKNEIRDLTDLVNYVEILRNTSNLQGEDRQMLFDFAFLITNEQLSLKSFFAENFRQELYNQLGIINDNVNVKSSDSCFTKTSDIIDEINKMGCSLTPSKEFYNAFKQTTSSPTFMDEVLDSNTTVTEVPNFNLIDVEQILPKHILDILEKQEDIRPKVVSESGEKLTFDENFNLQEVGKKEKTGKLHYELSWEFIEEMAKRMANNKSDKYPLYNWKKKINVQDLKDAINRHHVEVMKGNYKDGDEIFGHIVQYACNSMMLWEQLRNKS